MNQYPWIYYLFKQVMIYGARKKRSTTWLAFWPVYRVAFIGTYPDMQQRMCLIDRAEFCATHSGFVISHDPLFRFRLDYSMKNKIKTGVIIPSRYGSSRFPGKPLALIGGKPMIQQVYERASQAQSVDDVAVATDDSRIADAVNSFGGKAVLTSPENRSGTDRVAEAAEKLGYGEDDIIINVQGDQPLLDPRCLNDVLSVLVSNPDVGMSTLAFRIVNEDEITNPKDVKVTFDNRGIALYFSRSSIPYCRDKGTAYDTYKHLGVYAYTKRFLNMFRALPEGVLERVEKLEQLRALEHGHSIIVKVTAFDSPEVDLPEDIAKIEAVSG
jgi:3-deoxy-manno-octulosonate cytidylyltransferase (CMP-KDO synthetase)